MYIVYIFNYSMFVINMADVAYSSSRHIFSETHLWRNDIIIFHRKIA